MKTPGTTPARRSIQLWNLDDRRLVESRPWPLGTMNCLALDSAEESLLVGGAFSESTGAWLWSVQGSLPLVPIAARPVRAASFHLSEPLVALALGTGEIFLVDTETGNGLVHLIGHSDAMGQLLFTPYGETLISLGSLGDARFWSSDSRVED